MATPACAAGVRWLQSLKPLRVIGVVVAFDGLFPAFFAQCLGRRADDFVDAACVLKARLDESCELFAIGGAHGRRRRLSIAWAIGELEAGLDMLRIAQENFDIVVARAFIVLPAVVRRTLVAVDRATEFRLRE